MKGLLDILLEREQQLLLEEIRDKFSLNKGITFTHEQECLINNNLLLNNQANYAFQVHRKLIDSLVLEYAKHKFGKQSKVLDGKLEVYEQYVFGEFLSDKAYEIPLLIEAFHISFLNSEFKLYEGEISRKKSKHYIKESGAVYTLEEISEEITSTTIENYCKKENNFERIKCLDFASGTGRFYFQALEYFHKHFNLPYDKIISNNLYAIDNDYSALSVLRCKALAYVEELHLNIIESLFSNIICKNSLIVNSQLIEEDDDNFDFEKDFNGLIMDGGFDVVFSNPPYCLLKVNKKDTEKSIYYEEVIKRIQKESVFFRNSGFYTYSIEGMLNYYQLSIEMIIRITKSKGEIGIICPSSIFGDLTSSKLRKHILEKHKLRSIKYFTESARLFENVAQATVIFYIEKSGQTKTIDIKTINEKFKINFETVKKVFPTNLEIPLIDQTGWAILNRLSDVGRLKHHPFIRNRRGELDLTLFKSNITNKNTGWRLVRGNMINGDEIVDKNGEFVEIEDFINKKSDEYKNYDFNKVRLICQQISNVDCFKRLKFVICKEQDIIGNSCNYITSTRSEIDLKKLYYILNSSLLNWRFKITSSNNHINNYELDELPIIDLSEIELDSFSNDEIENDKLICSIYGLTEDETNYLLDLNTTQTKKRKIKEYEAI